MINRAKKHLMNMLMPLCADPGPSTTVPGLSYSITLIKTSEKVSIFPAMKFSSMRTEILYKRMNFSSMKLIISYFFNIFTLKKMEFSSTETGILYSLIILISIDRKLIYIGTGFPSPSIKFLPPVLVYISLSDGISISQVDNYIPIKDIIITCDKIFIPGDGISIPDQIGIITIEDIYIPVDEIYLYIKEIYFIGDKFYIPGDGIFIPVEYNNINTDVILIDNKNNYFNCDKTKYNAKKIELYFLKENKTYEE